MEKKKLKQVAPRVSEQTLKFYTTHWPKANAAAEWVLEAFPLMVKMALVELRGKLTAGELKMIIDVCNGTAMLVMGSGQLTGQHIALNVADSFDLYPGTYEETWGVEKDAMLKKIGSLTRFQLTALEIWAAGFWEGDYQAEDAVEKYIKALV